MKIQGKFVHVRLLSRDGHSVVCFAIGTRYAQQTTWRNSARNVVIANKVAELLSTDGQLSVKKSTKCGWTQSKTSSALNVTLTKRVTNWEKVPAKMVKFERTPLISSKLVCFKKDHIYSANAFVLHDWLLSTNRFAKNPWWHKQHLFWSQGVQFVCKQEETQQCEKVVKDFPEVEKNAVGGVSSSKVCRKNLKMTNFCLFHIAMFQVLHREDCTLMFPPPTGWFTFDQIARKHYFLWAAKPFLFVVIPDYYKRPVEMNESVQNCDVEGWKCELAGMWRNKSCTERNKFFFICQRKTRCLQSLWTKCAFHTKPNMLLYVLP